MRRHRSDSVTTKCNTTQWKKQRTPLRRRGFGTLTGTMDKAENNSHTIDTQDVLARMPGCGVCGSRFGSTGPRARGRARRGALRSNRLRGADRVSSQPDADRLQWVSSHRSVDAEPSQRYPLSVADVLSQRGHVRIRGQSDACRLNLFELGRPTMH